MSATHPGAPPRTRGSRHPCSSRTATSAAFAVLALALLGVLAAAPWYASRALLRDGFFLLTMLALAQSWNLLAGYAGLVSIGQQAFVGIGGYALFWAVSLAGLDPLAGLLAGGVAAALLAVPTARFAFRLDGAHFAIATWVVAEVVRLSLAQVKSLGGGTGTSLANRAVKDTAGIDAIRTLFGVKGSHAVDILCWWLALALAAFALLAAYRLLRSRAGLALTAVRDDAGAARSVGVDARVLRFRIFVGCAFVTGLAGALIYLQKARISPDTAFSVVDWTAYVIFIVVIGGIGTIEGPILGVIVFLALQKLLADFGAWYLLVLGLSAIATMLLAPRGLWGLFHARTGLEPFALRRRLVSNDGSPRVPAARARQLFPEGSAKSPSGG